MMRLKDFAANGIGAETLARLVRDGSVIRPARGLYQLADGSGDAARILAEASVLVPRGVICLTSALQFHELTLRVIRRAKLTPIRGESASKIDPLW
jgi:predicted transcriptional regulator of viral defense system